MKRKLLIIGFVWPEPKSSAAGSRMLQLINLFQKYAYDITFASTANTSKNTFDLVSIGVTTKAIALNSNSFDQFVKDLNPDVVMFDRFMTEEQFGWRVAEQCPNALRLLDTEDFHGLRKARTLAFKANEELQTKHLYNDTTKREIASIYRCDLSLMISEAEIELLTQQFKIEKNLLYYLPFLIEATSNQPNIPDFELREHFVTIGNFLHEPNYNAVLYLKQEIWPLIRQHLPKVQMHIYGAYESQKVKQLHNEKEGFLIKGFAEDVNEVMQNTRVCLAPLRFGAGLKGKLIDAMQNGTPCVMTNIAAEGMFGGNEANGFIEDTPEEFAQKAIEVYTNKVAWGKFQNNGFQILKERFDASHFEAHFAKHLNDLVNNLNLHRQANFLGQLFQHHTLQSTKYLSKWIEAKNKSTF